MSVSVLLLTLNEESNLPRCLRALEWCDDVIVVDSYSSDSTTDIAKQAGARIVQRRFDDFASQRNFALDGIEFRHEWILHLDADEVCTDPLRREIMAQTDKTSLDAFRIPSKTMFFGRWLRYAGMYPTYQVRLGRHPVFRFRQVGHGQREAIEASRIGTLNEPYLHYTFSKGLDAWFEKVNRYTTHEAQAISDSSRDAARAFTVSGLLTDAVQRRRALKQLSYRLPYRPALRFFYMYGLRLGFLDGMAGWRYCRMLAAYEWMIDMKLRELQQRVRGGDV